MKGWARMARAWSGCSLGIPRCNALILPFCDLGIDPADTTTTKGHWLGKIAARHPFIDRRMAKTRRLLHLMQPQKTAHAGGSALVVGLDLVFGVRRHQLSPKQLPTNRVGHAWKMRQKLKNARPGNYDSLPWKIANFRAWIISIRKPPNQSGVIRSMVW